MTAFLKTERIFRFHKNREFVHSITSFASSFPRGRYCGQMKWACSDSGGGGFHVSAHKCPYVVKVQRNLCDPSERYRSAIHVSFIPFPPLFLFSFFPLFLLSSFPPLCFVIPSSSLSCRLYLSFPALLIYFSSIPFFVSLFLPSLLVSGGIWTIDTNLETA